MATHAEIANPIYPDFHGYLDPDFVDYYNTKIGIRPSTHQIPFSDVRANPKKYRGEWCRDYSNEPRVKTFEITSGDGTKFRARYYYPDPLVFGPGPYPVHVNYHGGISAGGFMSCVYQHMARDAGRKLKLAVLCVPTTRDRSRFKKLEDAGFSSYVENELAPCLDWKRLIFFTDIVGDRTLVPKLWNEPFYEEKFDGICDTFIATAGADPVREEGEAWGMRLVRAGCKVTFRRYIGVPHIFQAIQDLEKTRLYVEDACMALKTAHGV